MSRKRAILRITLKSDLCVGSGYSYAGIIDSDVCYTQNGFPYILGRRIKGCLRDAAELINVKDIDSIFGIGGNNVSGSLMLGNAYLADIEAIDQELSAIKKSKSEYSKFATQQNILGLFTSVKAQTSIDKETGVADDTTLRYTRVINHYSPLDGKEMQFLAEVEFDCQVETMSNIVKALRHMGMDRNRGLGNVSCSLEKVQDISRGVLPKVSENQRKVTFTYLMKNLQPLVMSGRSDVESDSFIRGQSVLGMLAHEYLGYEGAQSTDKAFQDIFVNGKAIFSDLNISRYDGDNIHIFAPSPMYISKLKITKKLINTAREEFVDKDSLEEAYKASAENRPKKIKNQFICCDDNGDVYFMEPEKDIVFHHSTRNPYDKGKLQEKPDGKEGILYSMEVLCEGQFFAGNITVEACYADIIRCLLKNASPRFGKSKSAQYGACELVKVCENTSSPKTEFKKGDKLLVTFESDAIFMNHSGYTTKREDVIKQLVNDLGISVVDNEQGKLYLETDVVYGYNTTWNLKKPSIPVIKAGSAIELCLAEDVALGKTNIGERCHEGFGRVSIQNFDTMPYIVKNATDNNQAEATQEACKPLLKKIMVAEIANILKGNAYANTRIQLNASTLGRVTLMLKESLAQRKLSSIEQLENFVDRVSSIKRDEERGRIQRFIKQFIFDNSKCKLDSKDKTAVEKYFAGIKYLDMSNKELSFALKCLKNALEPHEIQAHTYEEILLDMWGEYLMHILVYQKYLGKLQ